MAVVSETIAVSDEPPKAIPKGLQSVVREGRISVDFHNVLDVAESGDSGCNDIHPQNRGPLADFAREVALVGFRVGICSYIGERGEQSAARRSSLINSVRSFNSGLSQNCKVGVRIVSKSYEKASCLRDCGFSVHLDDRQDILAASKSCLLTTAKTVCFCLGGLVQWFFWVALSVWQIVFRVLCCTISYRMDPS